ncbi:hypothetical protein Tco_1015732 [Tanacetum coccineum]|uniref:Retrovirus-related Pol polyprotein from transposon TNT 1-94 n=1 Tax=Tanacetum coccineum TaxID=301880 RepID=A0ABQ5FP34_9ASTR
MGLWYTKDSGFELTRFSYADYAGCKYTFKSTSSGTQFLGEKLLEDYGFHFNKIPIYCDLKSAIALSCNPVQHSRTKHVAFRYHFIKEHLEKGMIELYFVKTDYQLADLFTKALLVDRFNYLVHRLGMCNLSLQELERLAKSRQKEGLSRNTPIRLSSSPRLIEKELKYSNNNDRILNEGLLDLRKVEGCMVSWFGDGFFGGERDGEELVVVREVGVFLLGRGDGGRL